MNKGSLMAAAAGLVLLAGVPALAQSGANLAEKGPAAAPTAAARGVEQADLAARLADYGRQARNPQAVILAAEILAGVGAHDEARAKTSEAAPGAPATAQAAPKTDKPAMSVAALLDEARAMAGPDASYAPAIQRVAALESKGRVEGPARQVDRVSARTTDVFTIRFRGGEPAYINVDGDGDTDLDLVVYDQNGNRVCSDTDDTDYMICRWTPAWTGEYKVKITNYGSVYNQYLLLTN